MDFETFGMYDMAHLLVLWACIDEFPSNKKGNVKMDLKHGFPLK